MSGSCMKWLLGWGALKRRDLLIGKERCRKGGIREKRQIWLCCVLLRVLLENKVGRLELEVLLEEFKLNHLLLQLLLIDRKVKRGHAALVLLFGEVDKFLFNRLIGSHRDPFPRF